MGKVEIVNKGENYLPHYSKMWHLYESFRISKLIVVIMLKINLFLVTIAMNKLIILTPITKVNYQNLQQLI